MPWVADGVTEGEMIAVEAVGGITPKDTESANMIASLPWFTDGITEDERWTLDALYNIATTDAELAKMVANLPWFTDGVTNEERNVLGDLDHIASTDADLARTVATLPWFTDDITEDERWTLATLHRIASTNAEIANIVAGLPWFIDGITEDEQHAINELDHIAPIDEDLAKVVANLLWLGDGITAHEASAIFTLGRIAESDLGLARTIAILPWFTNDITEDERWTLATLNSIAETDVELATMVTNLPWLTDGVTEREGRALNAIGRIAGIDRDLASELAASVKDPTRDLDIYALEAFGWIAGHGDDALGRLTSQPWYADGLSDEEYALIVVLGGLVGDSSALYDDLIQTHFIQTRTVLLSLAREVNIYVIQNSPFPPYEELPRLVEESARTIEDFVEIPFPTTDIILLIADPNHGLGYKHHITYMVVTRWGDSDVLSIPHETAHYYSHGGPGWFVEGGADFLETYVHDRTGVQNLADSRIDLSWSPCLGKFDNIRHYTYLTGQLQSRCRYSLGENILISVFDTIGEDAMSAAVRDLYLQSLDSGQPPTEEEIYRVFLEHAPADKKEAFRDVYQRLHGGAFAFDKVPFDDDHADEAGLATHIVVGESVGGVLDYMFDFDYFTFQAEEWQKYRITVNHESLGVSSVTLYDTEGLTQGRWKSRSREASGILIQWVAPSSEEYYFAVQNFGGKEGPYTITITDIAPIEDDHGDTIATATGISLGEVVRGTIDDYFDFDYFQFQAAEGKSYRIVIAGAFTGVITDETLEYFRHHLYTAGVPHDDIEYRYEYRYWRDSVSAEHMVDAELEWTPLSSGTFYLATDAPYGIIGTYTVTITAVDDDSDD